MAVVVGSVVLGGRSLSRRGGGGLRMRHDAARVVTNGGGMPPHEPRLLLLRRKLYHHHHWRVVGALRREHVLGRWCRHRRRGERNLSLPKGAVPLLLLQLLLERIAHHHNCRGMRRQLIRTRGKGRRHHRRQHVHRLLLRASASAARKGSTHSRTARRDAVRGRRDHHDSNLSLQTLSLSPICEKAPSLRRVRNQNGNCWQSRFGILRVGSSKKAKSQAGNRIDSPSEDDVCEACWCTGDFRRSGTLRFATIAS
jgi:hypothetical protein